MGDICQASPTCAAAGESCASASACCGGIACTEGVCCNGSESACTSDTDCCGGLSPGKVEEAFAPFTRFDERQSGFGLGLAISKQAAEAHGGSIRVQNLPGKGCIFVLELPVTPAVA